MGSYGKAIMAGFICRLCLEQKKCVIHLYSVKAKRMSLLEKITVVPIKVDKYDKLPKTVCEKCIEKLDMQYKLIEQIKQSAGKKFDHRLLQALTYTYRRPEDNIDAILATSSDSNPSSSDENDNENGNGGAGGSQNMEISANVELAPNE